MTCGCLPARVPRIGWAIYRLTSKWFHRDHIGSEDSRLSVSTRGFLESVDIMVSEREPFARQAPGSSFLQGNSTLMTGSRVGSIATHRKASPEAKDTWPGRHLPCVWRTDEFGTRQR